MAKSKRKFWTKYETTLLKNPKLSDKEIAKMIGKSVNAVRLKRRYEDCKTPDLDEQVIWAHKIIHTINMAKSMNIKLADVG